MIIDIGIYCDISFVFSPTISVDRIKRMWQQAKYHIIVEIQGSKLSNIIDSVILLMLTRVVRTAIVHFIAYISERQDDGIHERVILVFICDNGGVSIIDGALAAKPNRGGTLADAQVEVIGNQHLRIVR